jgi:2Fe-2S ferredoxin
MGGTNPYIAGGKSPKLPQKKYSLVLKSPKGESVTLEVDPSKLPLGDTGQPGSILDVAMANGVDIDHACGGVVACSTCHVWVKKGLSSCNEASDEELDQIEKAPKSNSQSRLACQCVPDGSADIVEVEIPRWNRNLAREGK